MERIERPGRAARAATFGTALAVTVVVGLQLVAAVPHVPNRHALGYDAARRAQDDVEAADALRHLDPVGIARWIVAPQTWPTLRLWVAAPVHVLAGPARALAVEHGVSLAFTLALLGALAATALVMAPRGLDALAILAVSAPLVLGNGDLLENALNGMLELPEAVFTTLLAAAWLHERRTGTERPWRVALAANALFHVKFQIGLMLAAAVLVWEAREAGLGRVVPPLLRALGRCARTVPGAALLVAGLVGTALGLWLVHRGGYQGRLLGIALSMREPRGPRWFGATALFAFVELAAWQARTPLRAAVPPRLRFLWTWLVVAMGVWLLLPFTWRLEQLGASVVFDSHQVAPGSTWEALTYFPRRAWVGWFRPGVRPLVVALAMGTVVAAWRRREVRAVLVPLAVLVGGELAVLTFFNHRNHQPRLDVNLEPLVALGLAAWVPAVTRASLRAGLAIVVAAVLVVAVLPVWRTPALAATLAGGFETEANGDACRTVARALPLRAGVLVNETDAPRSQACNMWVRFVARETGSDVRVRAAWPTTGPHEVLLLTDGTRPPGPRGAWTPDGPPVRAGVVVGQRFRSE